jgi:hypothetical protein
MLCGQGLSVAGISRKEAVRSAQMSWYAANAIFVFKYKSGKQKQFPIWENVYLIEADTDAAARQKAEEVGKANEGEDDTLTVGGHPATLEYRGIRKLITIQNPFPHEPNDAPPTHGTEITYSEFSVGSEEDIDKLVGGCAVSVLYEE